MYPQKVQIELAARVRQARLFENWTQQELAERADVALPTLKRFEKTGEISLQRLIRIASVLGCLDSFDHLFPQKEVQGLRDYEEKRMRQRARKKVRTRSV